MVLKILRARFFAEFTLSGRSEILRCAQNDKVEAFFRSLFSPANAALKDGATVKLGQPRIPDTTI